MDLAERLKLFIVTSGLSNSEFADRAGVSRPTLSQLLSGRNKTVNDAFIKKIHAAYPMLSMSWLLFDEGEMVTDPNFEFSSLKNGQNPAGDVRQDDEYQAVTHRQELNLFGDEDESDNFSVTKSPEKSLAERNLRAKDTKDAKTTDNIGNASASTSDSGATVQLQPDQSKQIKNIMVFYTDNSYQLFLPATSENR